MKVLEKYHLIWTIRIHQIDMDCGSYDSYSMKHSHGIKRLRWDKNQHRCQGRHIFSVLVLDNRLTLTVQLYKFIYMIRHMSESESFKIVYFTTPSAGLCPSWRLTEWGSQFLTRMTVALSQSLSTRRYKSCSQKWGFNKLKSNYKNRWIYF